MSRAAARRLAQQPAALRSTTGRTASWSPAGRIGEAVATTVLGAGLAGAVGMLVDMTLVAAVIGAANGAVGGWRRIYRWRSMSGWAAIVLDSTWALVTTAAALGAHAVAAWQRHPGNVVVELSERRDRHVYERGYVIRRGFLLTVGNVVNGAGSRSSRSRTVDQHEHIHVWQARWFGPLFPALYAVWWFAGAVLAVAVWSLRRPAAAGFGATVDALGYYRNPFEWWAYSREGRWPPPRAVADLVWRRPLASPRQRSA